jgi:hypothetical protein
MSEKLRTYQKNDTKKPTTKIAQTQQQAIFESSPFGTESQQASRKPLSLKTELMRAQHYGHNLTRMPYGERAIQRKAYDEGNNEITEEGLSENAQSLVRDEKTRRFKSKTELKEYSVGKTENIGTTEDGDWVRVDDFTVLGEDHSKPLAPKIISAINTNKFRYEGFTDTNPYMTDKKADKEGFEGKAASEDRTHAAENSIAKVLRVIPDVKLMAEKQPKEGAVETAPGINIEDKPYQLSLAVIRVFKEGLELCQTTTNDSLNKFYQENKDDVDTSINVLNEKLPEIPKIKGLPIFNKIETMLKVFKDEAFKAVPLGTKYFGLKNRSLEDWKNLLGDKDKPEPINSSDSDEANEYDRLRDRSMYLTILDSKNSGDLLFVIGDAHRQRLAPRLKEKNIKHILDEDFLESERKKNQQLGKLQPGSTENKRYIEDSIKDALNGIRKTKNEDTENEDTEIETTTKTIKLRKIPQLSWEVKEGTSSLEDVGEGVFSTYNFTGNVITIIAKNENKVIYEATRNV